MSTYEWRNIEYTCDGCGKKHKNGDRSKSIPTGWIIIEGFKHQTSFRCTSSKPGKHFCSPACLLKVIEK